MKNKISVVINTRNEEKLLPRAIGSVRRLADEIVVVDMESDDKSVWVAKGLGARVFRHKRLEYVEPARNFGIGKAKGPWILVLDPDEEVSPGLADELLRLTDELVSKGVNYYRLPRKNIIFGKWISGSRWWPDYLVRFFRKGTTSWTEVIHDEPRTVGDGKNLEARESLAIVHHHYDNIEKFIKWADRYAGVRARIAVEKGYRFAWGDLVRKPMGEFLSRYFYGEGYKDGVHGLALALLQAVAELLVYVKVWEKEGFLQEDLSIKDVGRLIKDGEKEMDYWLAESILKTEKNPIKKLHQKVIRKLSS